MGGTIGVFDSGVGGLSVLHHIRQLLPHERLIYVADSGHVPYGDKSPAYIEARSLAITRFLIDQGADAIVIACNTATAAAAHTLRVKFNKVPIVGMEPAVKPAVAATKSGVVGVLATVGTLESARFAALLEKYAGHVKIITQGCHGLVEAVERGDLQSVAVRQLIERYTAPLLAQGADTLILGCTHYPFLTPLIRDVVGENITLVDTGEAVARQLQRRIQTELLSCRSGFSPAISTNLGQTYRAEARPTNIAQFFTSGDTEQASRIMSLLWGENVVARQLPESFS
jgi:glutamate racemase